MSRTVKPWDTGSRLLPVRALGFARYPQRAADAARSPSRRAAADARLPPRLERCFESTRTTLAAADAETLRAAARELAGRLARDGLADEVAGEALAVASVAMTRALGKTPYDVQIRAAWLLLDGRLAEMATGEGKTLAAALAAAVAALGGAPVHLMTANDYLVARDRALAEPFYCLLGLTSACVLQSTPRAERSAAYGCDIVHVTARELVFDYLNDHLQFGAERDPRWLRAQALARSDGPSPVLPGLHFAIVDEADSILLDEACVPLVLSRPGAAADCDSYQRAFAVAAALESHADYQAGAARHAMSLTAAGQARVAEAVCGAGGLLVPARRAFELVEAALAAQLSFARDREYVVTAAGIGLIDETTGRIATGRRWTGPLHPMVEIKEGLAPTAPAVTAAQITFQRFFSRYLHLSGMSGTLIEAARELRTHYRVAPTRVPLVHHNHRHWLGMRMFADQRGKWQAIVDRAATLVAEQRPVLIGTGSVGESRSLGERLSAAGVAHQVLNAVQDADEAACIARAGSAGAVTVATNIAGRGTDIRLDARAREAGGLHVIATLVNRSRRIDRQLFGRAARHGDPGSAESIVALDDRLFTDCWPASPLRGAAMLSADGRVPCWLARAIAITAQRRAERQDAALRRRLSRADAGSGDLYGFAGGTE